MSSKPRSVATFSPPRRGCEGEGSGASRVENEMAHVFVIGAAAGAVGSIVGASSNRNARARHIRSPFRYVPCSSPSRKRQDGEVSRGCLRDHTRREPSCGLRNDSRALLEHPRRRVASLTAPAPPPRPVPAVSSLPSKTPPSSGNRRRQSKSRRRLARTSPTRTAFTTRRPPRSSPSAKPRRRLASPASRRCSRSSPRSSRRRSKKPRRA